MILNQNEFLLQNAISYHLALHKTFLYLFKKFYSKWLRLSLMQWNSKRCRNYSGNRFHQLIFCSYTIYFFDFFLSFFFILLHIINYIFFCSHHFIIGLHIAYLSSTVTEFLFRFFFILFCRFYIRHAKRPKRKKSIKWQLHCKIAQILFSILFGVN